MRRLSPRTVRVRAPRRGARAVLAMGLVLGTGAGATLAAWTDPVLAEGDFRASVFDVEANASSPYDPAGPWLSPEDDPSAFDVDTTPMVPGSVRYAPLALRTVTGSIGGTVMLEGAAVEADGSGDADLGSALRYRIIASSTCDASAFTTTATYLIGGPSNTVPLTTGQDPSSPAPLPAATADAPGPVVRLCLELTLPQGAADSENLQGRTMAARWTVIAVSESP